MAVDGGIVAKRRYARRANVIRQQIRARLYFLNNAPASAAAVEKARRRERMAADGGYLREPDGDEAVTYQIGAKLTEPAGVELTRRANAAGVPVGTLVREILMAYLTG